MKPKAFVALVGAVLILAGMVVGFAVNTTVLTNQASLYGASVRESAAVSCGSTFVGADLSATPLGTRRAVVQAQCATASSPALIVWLLIGLGVVSLTGAMFIKTPERAAAA